MTGELPIDLPVERSPSPDGLETTTAKSFDLGVNSKGTLGCLGCGSDDASWILDSLAAASPAFHPRQHTFAAYTHARDMNDQLAQGGAIQTSPCLTNLRICSGAHVETRK